MTPSLRGAPNWALGVLAIVIISGAALRGVALDTQGFWHDEVYSVAHLHGFDAYLFPGSDLNVTERARPVEDWQSSLTGGRYLETLRRNLVHEGHPPLYQLGLKVWTRIFGTSTWAIRSFSLIPGLMSIAVLYLLGAHFWDRRAGLVAAAITATSPFQLYFSVEARNYSWAILFSALSVLAISRLWSTPSSNASRWMALWWTSVAAASYTHYYAGLYCGALLLLSLPSAPSKRHVMHLSVPFLAFVPWLPLLRQQLGLHSDGHWTAGAPGLVESFWGFGTGMLDQLTGVFGSAGDVERGIAATAIIVALALRARRGSDVTIPSGLDRIFLSVPLFALLVVLVDLATNHHTIMVPRYSSSALPALTLIVVSSVSLRPRVGAVLLMLLVSASAIGSIETVRGARAPKQMLREAAAFIAQEYEEGDVVLATPSGPTMIGMALYLPPHVMLGAVRPEDSRVEAESLAQAGTTVWVVAQRLGVSYELQPQRWFTGTQPVRFAGLDVYRVERDQRP